MINKLQDVPRGALPVLYKRATSGAVIEWEIWVEPVTQGHGMLTTCYGHQGGKKQTLQERIREGKNTGRKNATTAYAQACAEAIARWTKQKSRKGYGLTANESQAIRAASPMLAKVFEKERKKVHWDNAFTQPKFDGFRGLARRRELANGKLGKPVLTSRENQPLESLDHIIDALNERLPFDRLIILDGELYRHGFSLPQVSSACKKKGPLSRQIEYHIYDTVAVEDFPARHKMLTDLRLTSSECLKQVETVKVHNQDELMVCQKEFIGQGFEGAMLRHGTAGYEAGKRSSYLLKVKTFLTDEFEIVDYKMGRGKYEGMPVFSCTTKTDHLFDVLAPGNLEEKRALGINADACIGKLLTVKYQYLTETEEPVPFLPVAICLRDD